MQYLFSLSLSLSLLGELGLHGLITQDQSRGDFTASSLPTYHRDKLSE